MCGCSAPAPLSLHQAVPSSALLRRSRAVYRPRLRWLPGRAPAFLTSPERMRGRTPPRCDSELRTRADRRCDRSDYVTTRQCLCRQVRVIPSLVSHWTASGDVVSQKAGRVLKSTRANTVITVTPVAIPPTVKRIEPFMCYPLGCRFKAHQCL